MIIEVTIACTTLLAISCMIFTHFERNRVKPTIFNPQDLVDLKALIEAQNYEIKKLESKVTKGAMAQVFK